LPWTKPAEAAQDFLRLSLTDIDADICVEQIARFHLQALARLRYVVLALGEVEILRQRSEQVEGPSYVVVLFAQDNLVATAEDFNFLALETELFRQPYCLTVSRT